MRARDVVAYRVLRRGDHCYVVQLMGVRGDRATLGEHGSVSVALDALRSWTGRDDIPDTVDVVDWRDAERIDAVAFTASRVTEPVR